MFSNSIKNAWRLVDHLRVGGSFVNPSSLSPSSEFKNKSRDDSVSYPEAFRSALRNIDYNFQLFEYSIFQFSQFSDESLRFAFYPNPFISGGIADEISDLEEYLEEGVIDYEEYSSLISDNSRLSYPPIIRYEFSPRQYQELVHPCAHLHIGHHNESRWPVRRKLNPEAFSAMVLKLFFSEQWHGSPSLARGRELVTTDELYSIYYKNCQMLQDEYFSDREKVQFCWG